MFSVGPFDLLEPLGRGGHAEVWRARHRATGHSVAVKVLAEGGRAHVDAVRAEIRVAASLRHPHIVAVLDQGLVPAGTPLAEATPWLAMELAEGSLAGRTLPWQEVRRVLVQLLDALAYAHARGVVHRDVKPANVLVAADGIRLADFGLARAVDIAGAGLGTPGFMAPEQQERRRSDQGPWTDLYAVGRLAEAVAAGRTVPAGFPGWIARLTQPETVDRFRWAADARHALMSLGAPSTVLDGDAPEAASTLDLDAPEPVRVHRADPLPVVPSPWPETTPPAPRPPPPPAALGAALHGLRETALVGRERERAVLWARAREALVEGRPRGVLLQGAPGVGRSRLARWCGEAAHAAGFAAFVADHGDGIAGICARWLGVAGLEGDRLRRRVASLAEGDDQALLDALGRSRSRVVHPERLGAVARLLRRTGGDRGVVVWLQDPWEDAELQALVHELLDGEGRVLVLVTVREGAPADDVGALQAHPAVDALEVGPLPPSAHPELVREVLGLQGDLANEVSRRAAGHPLFAVHLVAHWVQLGILAPSGSGWVLRDGSARWPETLEGLCRARLAHAAGAAGAAGLGIAARMGLRVDVRTWRAACESAGVSPPAGLLGRMVDLGLARQRDDGWVWAHPALREAAWPGIEPVRGHRAIATVLEREGGRPAEVAHHWLEAGALSEASTWLEKAVAVAMRRADPAQGLRLVARWKEALTRRGVPPSDPAWGDVQLAEANALVSHDHPTDGVRVAERVLRGCDRHGWALRPLARVALARGVAASGGMDRAREALEAALVELPEGYDRARCLNNLALLLGRSGQRTRAVAHLREAAELYAASGEPTGWADAQRNLGHLLTQAGRTDEALACFEAAAETFAANGSWIGLALLQTDLGELHRVRGDLDAAEACYRKALSYDRRGGGRDPHYPRLNLGLLARQKGDDALAQARLEEALRGAVASGAAMVVALLEVVLLPDLAAAGDWDRFERHLLSLERLQAHAFADPDLADALARALPLVEGERAQRVAAGLAWQQALLDAPSVVG